MPIVINGTTGISGVDGSAGTPAVQGTDTNTGVFYPAADTVGVSTGGSERVRVDSSGNVGIGTSNTPSNKDTVTPKLVVNGSGVAGAMQVVRNTTVGAGGAILELTATRGSDVNSYTILQSGDGVGSVVFGGADGNEFVVAGSVQCQVDGTPGDNDMPGRLIFNTTADGASSPSERMRIDSSGNVGIGTTNPLGLYNAALAVVSPNTFGTVTVKCTSTTGAAGLSVQNDAGTSDAFLYSFNSASGSTNTGIGTSKNNPVLFYQNNTERMRIDSSGNVGIGLTPSYRLSVLDSAAGARVVDIQNTASTGNPIMQYSTMTVTGTTSNYFFVGRANASDRVYIYGSGNIVNVNNSYGALSDVKLKENITDATPKLSDLMRVKVRNYNLIGETQKQIGVVAQELEQVFPSMVDETIDRDTEGNELETTTKSVKYSVFVPMLIKAIQEQQALITSLTARIEALEAK